MLLFANMNASQMFVLLLSLCTFAIDALSTGTKQRTQTTTAAPTLLNPQPRPLSRKIQEAWERNIHPVETQEELGNGIFLTEDWRKAWFSYEDDEWIDPATGYANYEIDDIEGSLPADLVGTLYRNGPGKMGVNGQRVAHILDGDGVVLQITIPPPGKERKVQFQSRFVETRGFQEELLANQFIQQGTFGTGPMGSEPGKGINEDPNEPSLCTKLKERAFKTSIKNTANTQVVAFGGKLLTFLKPACLAAWTPTSLKQWVKMTWMVCSRKGNYL